VVSAAEEGIVPSFGIREVFTYLCQEFGQASLVLKFESQRMVGECELVVKLICELQQSSLVSRLLKRFAESGQT
jgi:hypothetical protein